MKRLGNWLVMFLKDERGAVMILVALLIVFVLIGMAALSVDVGYLYLQRRHLQNTADAAALAAAWELPWENSAITSTALLYAGHNHIDSTASDTSVVVTDPYGDRRKVKVEITKNYPLFFALAPPIGQSDADVYAMAVATKRMPGLELLPFHVTGYDEIIGDKYRYHDYDTNSEPVYKIDINGYNPSYGNKYDLVGEAHVEWGDWARNKSDFSKVLNDMIVTEIRLWEQGNNGNFDLADFADFLIDSYPSKQKQVQYVLKNGLDYLFCEDASKTRKGHTGTVAALEASPSDENSYKLSERLAIGQEEGYFVIFVLPAKGVEITGTNNSYGINDFLIGHFKPLRLENTNPFTVIGTLIAIIDCENLDPSSEYNRVMLIE